MNNCKPLISKIKLVFSEAPHHAEYGLSNIWWFFFASSGKQINFFSISTIRKKDGLSGKVNWKKHKMISTEEERNQISLYMYVLRDGQVELFSLCMHGTLVLTIILFSDTPKNKKKMRK